MALPAEKRRYTFADCLAWDESDRAEVINGEIVMMAPTSRVHQKISGELFRQLANFLEGKKCEAYAAPFAVRLFEKAGDAPEDVYTMVEPDISVVRDHDKLDSHGCKESAGHGGGSPLSLHPAPRPPGETGLVPAGRGTGILDHQP